MDLSGETNATLTFSATMADVGSYRVVVSNSVGTATSSPAALNLIQPGSFSMVVGDVALNSGDQAVVDKLTALGHTVSVYDDDGITLAATAAGLSFIPESSSDSHLSDSIIDTTLYCITFR